MSNRINVQIGDYSVQCASFDATLDPPGEGWLEFEVYGDLPEGVRTMEEESPGVVRVRVPYGENQSREFLATLSEIDETYGTTTILMRSEVARICHTEG